MGQRKLTANRSQHRAMRDRAWRLFTMFISMGVYIFDLCWTAIIGSILQRPSVNRCVCVYYHEIRDADRHRFAAQLDLLQRYAVVIGPQSIGHPLRGRLSVIVTFDDGFQSVVRNAIPLLLRRGIPSIHFVPARLLGERAAWDGAEKYDRSPETVMDALTLAELARDLVVIGSHTATHPVLPDLETDEIRAEFQRSREILRQYTGQVVDLLSFPYGQYDDRCIGLARDAGYQKVFTVHPSPIDGTASTYTLGRIKVSPTDWQLEFFLKFNGAYRWLAHASLYKLKLRRLCARFQRARLTSEPK